MAPFSRQQAAGPSHYNKASHSRNNAPSKLNQSPTANDNAESHGASTSSVTSPTLGFFNSGNAPSSSLRSRFSPRLSPDPSNSQSTFAAQQDTYPSPANAPSSGRNLLAGWGRKKKRTESMPDAAVMSEKPRTQITTPIASKFGSQQPGAPAGGWDYSADRDLERTRSHSPTLMGGAGSAFSVPRYDARGYPIRDAVPEIKVITPRSSQYNSPNGPSTPKHRPFSGASSEDDSPKLPRYPPSSFADRSSGASSSTPPKNSRPNSDASGSEYSDSVNMPYGAGISPGGSIYGGESVASLATQDTITSSNPHLGFAVRDANMRSFTQQQHRSPQSPSYYKEGMVSSPDDSEYGHFGFKREGKRILLNYGLENPALYASLGPEDDDDLHNPVVKQKQVGFGRSLLTFRGFSNVGCLALITLILVVLFMGYPIITEYTEKHQTNNGAFNLGGTNATGQVPQMRGPIDSATPEEARTKVSPHTGKVWNLIFSDEFNTDGRTFYPGDDPYWEAEDLHYWPTNNLEWYDPKQITTRDGSLVITLDNQKTNGMNYTGGSEFSALSAGLFEADASVMTTWNKFCFTGGYIEAAVSLPGRSDVMGLWPAIWSMGNLARAGYGGSTDGMWPYSYDTCDMGTLQNQSLNGLPIIEEGMGDSYHENALSYLSGQRLSSCTCLGDKSHPGPIRPDGTYVGRAAPEIDMFEAAVDEDTLIGEVSLSAQWAPFNLGYDWHNTSDTYTIFNHSTTHFNKYQGSIWQQATSALGQTNQNCYTAMGGCFSVYGVEWMPGNDAYITWVNDGRKAWTLLETGMAPDVPTGIGQRIVSREPMYMIVNLGISQNFGAIE